MLPPHFPDDPELDRLLDSDFDPRLGYFELEMFRRNARDLLKGLFGPEGVKDVPKGKGVRRFDLPNGWTLRLRYRHRPGDFRKPGYVDAEFIPPKRANQRSAPLARVGRPAKEARR